MISKAYFSSQTLQFLSDLRENNNREWFAANKEKYETFVRRPFLGLISDFQPLLRRISPRFVADSRPTGGSMFRIYRDVRFSEDKSPYKTHAAAHFPHAKARQKVHVPGYYLHIEPAGCFVAAGIWRPDTGTLTAIRKSIVQKPGAWKKVLSSGLEMEGETLSRPPRGFREDHPFVEDLKRKDFLQSVEFSDRQVCRADLLPALSAACGKMAPLLKFLTEAVGLPWK
jgi:uncharacterized protein (TIGR02453 family)